ncbi:MAG: hypothetical protein OCD01_03580 [Fibrobacterales bacterium]
MDTGMDTSTTFLKEQTIRLTINTVKKCALLFTFITSLIGSGLVVVMFFAATSSLKAASVPPQVVGGYTQLILEYENIQTALNQNSLTLQDSAKYVILDNLDTELTLYLPDSAHQYEALHNPSFNILDILDQTTLLSSGDTLFLYNDLKSVFLATSTNPIDSGTLSIEFIQNNSEKIIIDFKEFQFYTPWFLNTDSNGTVTPQEPIIANTGTYTQVNILAHSFNNAGTDTVACSAAICQSNTLQFITPENSTMTFHATPYGAELDSLPVINGFASFYIYNLDSSASTTFSLAGAPDLNNNNRLTYTHTAGVTFNLSPAPILDRAEMYDTNGDAIGDSLVITYKDDIITNIPDTIQYTWPTESATHTLSSHDTPSIKPGTSNTLTVKKPFTSSATSIQTGRVQSQYILDNGDLFKDQTIILDKIGPKLTQATLQSGEAGLPDTLYTNFSEPLKEQTYSGELFLTNNNTPVVATGTQLENGRWTFIVDKGLIIPNNFLTLNSTSLITDTSLNKPHSNNNGVTIASSPSLPTLAHNNGGYYDMDNNGALDRITLLFTEPISEEMLIHSDIICTWPNSSNTLITLHSGGTLTLNPSNPLEIFFDIPEETNIKQGVTTMDSSFGTPLLINNYISPATNSAINDTTPISLNDHIAPLLMSSHLTPSSSPSDPDTLSFTFSEAIISDTDFHSFTLNGYTNLEHTTPLTFSTNSPNTAFGTISHGTLINSRNRAGDSLITEAYTFNVKDLHNNNASSTSLQITGSHRISTHYNTFATYEPLNSNLIEQTAITEEFLTEEESLLFLDRKDKIGYLLDLTMGIPEENINTLNLEEISFSYQLFFHNTEGQEVIDQKGTIPCNSDGFNGNCFENPKKILINWNFKSNDGRFIASGVYYSQLIITITTPNASTSIHYSKKCGVLRGNNQNPF